MSPFPATIDPARFPEAPVGLKRSFTGAQVFFLLGAIFNGLVWAFWLIGLADTLSNSYATNADLLLAIVALSGSAGLFFVSILGLLLVRMGSSMEKAMWITNYHLVQLQAAQEKPASYIPR